MECRCRRHVSIAVRAACSTRRSVATRRAQERSCTGDWDDSVSGAGQSTPCRCRAAQDRSNAATRCRASTRARFQNRVACCPVTAPATSLFMALTWTSHRSMPRRARRSGRSIALSASAQSCIGSDAPSCWDEGVPDDGRPPGAAGSVPALVPELGDTINHAMTSSMIPIAVPPTRDATSRSSMRSSPPREERHRVLVCAPCDRWQPPQGTLRR